VLVMTAPPDQPELALGAQEREFISATTSTLMNRIVHTWNGGRTWQVQYTLAP
jgi:hypothetical protein